MSEEFIERKASDVLLEIEDKLDLLIQYNKDLKFKYELILQQNQEIKKILANKNTPSISEIPISESPKPSNSSKTKRVVRQKVVYPNTMSSETPLPVILANIKITNSDKKVINEKIKTDPKGVWTASLEPGEYFYHITKAPQGKKPLVDIYKPFSVSDNSTDPIELPFLL